MPAGNDTDNLFFLLAGVPASEAPSPGSAATAAGDHNVTDTVVTVDAAARNATVGPSEGFCVVGHLSDECGIYECHGWR